MTTTTHYLRFKHIEDDGDHYGIIFTVLGNDRVQVAKYHPYYNMFPKRIMPVAEARQMWRRLTTELCECYEEPRYEAAPLPR